MNGSAHKNDLAAAREDFYGRLKGRNISALWTVLHDLVTPQPRPEMAAAHWAYADVRRYLMEAGDLITAKEAERRALILENPAWPGESRITPTLYAAIQLVLPGDVAPAHRHTQSALRFVLEGSGAFTSVNGERTIMERGDFVITPSWTWHDHGNETDQPMIWLDGLDIPLVYFMNASFAEQGTEDRQALTKPENDAPARFGSGLLPVDYEAAAFSTSPVFNYPYARSRLVLEKLRAAGVVDPCHGIKQKYVHPGTGDFAMPTIATFLQLLPSGFASKPYRSTDSAVFVCVEGRGHSLIGDQRFDWGPNDLFVVPTWVPVTHHAEDDSVLFSYSDRGVQQKLGLWREDRMDEAHP
ncbi:gentisate 1,2-dioxygenase [Iodidimonas nitroreducens]|uniref:Gentisate 1,2-dioxygenase n=1 Tax=Iodidimonas nitroreducens TaxID=1236968 RepID=A0A5A7NAK4_9PROT|nr:gentisate 1,2-dioxygenase [Iodidimonas nitroreducens]GAK33797.1 gentisate 1,2-dioxygenase [alpha proteobacterium Q-1]GER04764.1 gentisate 1,2-dioxygenase [Iodidimonas nitroreducens]